MDSSFDSDAFATWWNEAAPSDVRARFRDVSAYDDAPVPTDLVVLLTQLGIVAKNTYWPAARSGPQLRLPQQIRAVIDPTLNTPPPEPSLGDSER